MLSLAPLATIPQPVGEKRVTFTTSTGKLTSKSYTLWGTIVLPASPIIWVFSRLPSLFAARTVNLQQDLPPDLVVESALGTAKILKLIYSFFNQRFFQWEVGSREDAACSK